MTCTCTHHMDTTAYFKETLVESDPDIARLIQQELWRQQDHIELIASENIVSNAVLMAQGSVFNQQIRRRICRPSVLSRMRLY